MQAHSFQFFDGEGARYHGGAIVYAVAGYVTSIVGLFANSWAINVLAVVFLGHAMTIAAYLVHECGHNTVFRNNRDNVTLGRFMSWICGASYGTFEDMRFKHFRHHVDNGDLVWFDYEAWFAQHPIVLKCTQWLEWCYVPAHELIMHGVMVFTSFLIPQRRGQRRRNLFVIVVRGGLYFLLLVLYPKVALMYAIAYMMMLIVLRFMDALQHDYGGVTTLFDKEPGPRRGDLVWEQAHTFTVPLSLKYEKLNWLVLNFGFHNAHHAKPTVPWFRLASLHREIIGDSPLAVIPFTAQLKIYHQGRVDRIYKWQEKNVYPESADFLLAAQQARIPGGNAASFLTSF